MLDGMEVLVFSVVLPYVAAEIWTMNKFFTHYKYIPNIIASAGYPALDYYFFFHKKLDFYIEMALVVEAITLFCFMAFITNVMYYVGTALTMYLAFVTNQRFKKMPIPECFMTKAETINYFLSSSILCASISMI